MVGHYIILAYISERAGRMEWHYYKLLPFPSTYTDVWALCACMDKILKNTNFHSCYIPEGDIFKLGFEFFFKKQIKSHWLIKRCIWGWRDGPVSKVPATGARDWSSFRSGKNRKQLHVSNPALGGGKETETGGSLELSHQPAWPSQWAPALVTGFVSKNKRESNQWRNLTPTSGLTHSCLCVPLLI